MSFGSFSLFNFFQQPNTGSRPQSLNTGIVASGNQASGKVADFNWYFPYGGTNITIGLIDAESRFGFHIWSDSDGAAVEGLHYEVISTSFSGTFGANGDRVSLDYSLYGQVYPQFNDIALCYSSFSGLISGTHYDVFAFNDSLTGKFTGQKFDTMYLGMTFSGEIATNVDIAYINLTASGIINKEPFDTFTGNHIFSGRMWPLHGDLSNISYAMIGYSVSTGFSVQSFTVMDSGNISFAIVGYEALS